MVKNNKGVTLTSLVIAIIVLLILTSIAVYSGVSTSRYTKLMKAKSEMETMQAQINSWYQSYKNGNEDVLSYGTKENFGLYNDAFQAAGIGDTSNYRLFSSNYINDDLGIDGINYDFLISIKDRKIILTQGITYENVTYYTLEDFGIVNVETNPISSVDFSLEKDNTSSTETDILIYDVVFSDSENKNVDISKYKIQYKSSDNNTWETVNLSQTTEYTAGDGTKYEAYVIKVEPGKTYQVKISTSDESVSETKSIQS